MRRAITFSVALIAVALLAVAAGAGGVAADPVADTAAECVDGDNEVVGCWNGVHHADHPAEDLGIDQSDGLTEDELENMTYLKMARVEAIRERPFEDEVPVETMTREEFTDLQTSGESDETFNRWNDQVWKALFVIGEDESSEAVIDDVFGGAVAGFYSPAQDRIVIVVDDEDEVRVSPTTLLHELGHAMQDQYDDLSDGKYSGGTQDADLAIDGAVEGEVVYIEEVYAERCGDEWVCTDEPSSAPAEEDDEPNLGVLLTVLQPYSDGAPYVDELIEEGGWEAVDDLMESPPNATTETIHREPFEPTPIEFEDTAEDGWETYDGQGVDGADTAGEASLFVTFWFQSSVHGADVMERDHLFDTAHPYENYNYVHPATDGWANDELYPYRNDEGDAERDGYVWETEWQTAEDAAEFREAYLQVLDAHDAELREDGVRYVADGDFRGAYGVEHDGTTVRITHALDPEEVFELRPDIELDDAEPTEVEPTEPTEEVTETAPPEETETPAEPIGGESDEVAPGFGVVAALAALVAAVVVARVRTRR